MNWILSWWRARQMRILAFEAIMAACRSLEVRLGRELTPDEHELIAEEFVRWIEAEHHLRDLFDRPIRTIELFASQMELP